MNSKGFSIIELIVSMAIIAILSVIIIPSYQNASRDLFLEEEARQLVRAIELTRAMAIASRDVGLGPVQFEGGKDYRIRITNNNYSIFVISRDQNNQTGGSNVITETFDRNLITDININNSITISFSPPDPEVRFFNNGTINDINDEIEITLGYRNEENKWRILINRVGLVRLERIIPEEINHE